MPDDKIIKGFSRLGHREKLEMAAAYTADPQRSVEIAGRYRHGDEQVQKLHDGFSENTLTNYYMPYGVAPNFLINGKSYMVPMVTEESSVVAAAARSAAFWAGRGGFRYEVGAMIKSGHVHFLWSGDKEVLKELFPVIKERMVEAAAPVTANMEKRGGGIRSVALEDMSSEIEGYFRVRGDFDTRDSMGANFINSCLEEFAAVLEDFAANDKRMSGRGELQVVMSILSNYTGGCRVKVSAECAVEELEAFSGGMPAEKFARKFVLAVRMAEVDVCRATTHNKGIFNGIDAVVIATGNDFRAVEAAGHAWASRGGRYGSLSEALVEDGRFFIALELPMAVGTVGGLTGLHPMARMSLEMLGNPGADELMGIAASAGLASNFAAVGALVTKGIQAGHMKMHLSNILARFGATESEREAATEYFSGRKVGYSAVEEFLNGLRGTGRG
ncbi:MAG: hydroxymethylglutaryl-CoA reductase [Marinilabiliales bacterium]|nr:MAG: hydroxymethylglutaryl-CoA reductase [Marinilabiliales bacterium]